MPFEEFNPLNVVRRELHGPLPTYSITGDILAYKTCPRQYGFFSQRGYTPAHNIQLWFGTIVHQVLDKLHQQYQGRLNPERQGQLPTQNDVQFFFNQINESLRVRGIKSYSRTLDRDGDEQHALRILQQFNAVEGASLYPNIRDTEYRFQNQQHGYILQGVVDVLKDTSEEEIPEGYDSVEVWDYKASKNPLHQPLNQQNQRRMRNYRFQLLVYAHMYFLKTGKYPKKGILYFLNELSNRDIPTPSPQQILAMRQKAVFSLDFTDPANIENIHEALDEFHQTVENIENCKQIERWDAPAADNLPGDDTCTTCDKRWDCPSSPHELRWP
ncbi:MAG: PD-(D/E)XK nuclease family protein [Clostridia bacterium]|jgi:putative RecB family exonuclease